MLGDGYVAGITSVIERDLAHASGAKVIVPGFEELGGAFLLIAIGE
jgi:hypothetical protein